MAMFHICPLQIKQTTTLQAEVRKLDARLIAVLPVDIKTGDRDAARMLREKLFDELYFKGYPKIPFEMVDAALADIRKRDGGASGSTVAPQVIGSMLGVDAVMYTTLLEANTKYRFVYAPVSVAAVFELRSVKTGDTIWKFESKADRSRLWGHKERPRARNGQDLRGCGSRSSEEGNGKYARWTGHPLKTG